MNSIQIFLQTDHSLFIETRLGPRQRLADLLQEEISPGQAKQRGIASLFCYGRFRGTARDPTDRRIVYGIAPTVTDEVAPCRNGNRRCDHRSMPACRRRRHMRSPLDEPLNPDTLNDLRFALYQISLCPQPSPFQLPAVVQAKNLCRKCGCLIDGVLYGHKLFFTDGLEELRKGSKAAGVRIGLCVLLIVGKGISVAPYADKRLGHNGEHS